MIRWGPLGLSAALILAIPIPAANAQSRQEEIAQQRQKKAEALQPPSRNVFEAVVFAIEDDMILDRILNPTRNFYPQIGGLGEGAGFGGGPGYRFLIDAVDFRASAAYSFKDYWFAEVRALFPHLANDWLVAEFRARRRSAPQEDFYGVGPDSSVDDRSNFALHETLVSGAAALQPISRFLLGGRVEYINPNIGSGTDSLFPSTDEVFTPADTPGLDEQPEFVRTQGFITFDYGDPPLNPVFGGRYTVTVNRYQDRNLDAYSFNRIDVDLRQYIPFLLRSHVIALRGYLSVSNPDEGHEVPFYLQPMLGGAYSARGFRSFRFRDRNLLLLQAEYRWDINALMTGALFCDAGKVARRQKDLDFEDMKSDCGFGVRFGTRQGVKMRLDLALGSGEGTRFLWRFDNVF